MPDRLAVLRVHQRDVDIDHRERAALLAAGAASADLLVLSTCHRVECYAAVPEAVEPDVWFAGRLGADPAQVGATLETDQDAARHLLRVACGLDSAIRGEAQILLQLRRTFDQARTVGPVHSLLADLFQTALGLGRELRATTPLGEVRRSIGSLAVEAGLALIGPQPAVLVIGVGEVGKLASRSLSTQVGTLVLANRDFGRATALAKQIGARAVGLDDLDAELARADLVISAADTRGALLTTSRLLGRLAHGPLVVIDVAVPRSVPTEARSLPGLTYRSVDDLQALGAPVGAEVVEDAEARCAAAAERFLEQRRARLATRTIEAMYDRAERIRSEQLERALGRLGHLAERDRRVVEALASGLTNGLLHAPALALRADPERAAAARALFDLEERA